MLFYILLYTLESHVSLKKNWTHVKVLESLKKRKSYCLLEVDGERVIRRLCERLGRNKRVRQVVEA